MTRGSMKGVVAAAAFALASTAPFSAHAICQKTGNVVTFNQFTFASQLFLTEFTFDPFVYFCNIFDVRVEQAAVAAGSNKNRVTVQGDLATCPTTGQPFRFIGNCTFIQLNP